MRIYIYVDACPITEIVDQIASQYNISVTLLCYTNHVLSSDYSDVKIIGAGADADDFALISMLEKDANDIVVTQDYGVAAMVLGRNALAIHLFGKWYTNKKIDMMLMEGASFV